VITHNLSVLHGHQPHDGHRRDKHLGVRLIEVLVVGVPSASFNEQTVDEGTIVGFLRCINTLGIRDDLEVVLDGIDRNLVLSGIVLLHTSKETVSEMEAGNPEAWRVIFIDPFLVLLESLHQVNNERSKGFKSVVRPLLPLLGHDVIKEPVSNFFELLTHDDFSLNGTTNVNERISDGIDESVVTEELLGKYSVHGFFVADGMQLSRVFSVELLRKLIEDTLGEVN
jgi:hypothetical protein